MAKDAVPAGQLRFILNSLFCFSLAILSFPPTPPLSWYTWGYSYSNYKAEAINVQSKNFFYITIYVNISSDFRIFIEPIFFYFVSR